jgi:hypothetical protein
MITQLRLSVVLGLCASLNAVVGQPVAVAAPIGKMTMSSTGTITKGGANVAGGRVALIGQTGGGLFFKSSGKSDAMGKYPNVSLPLYTPVEDAMNNVFWGVVGKKITVAGRVVSWDYGVDSDTSPHPGLNANLAIDKDIDLNLNNAALLPRWIPAANAFGAWLINDPTYTYTAIAPYQGTLSFSNAFFPTEPHTNVMGMIQYHDGSRATGNDVNESDTPISETIFDTFLDIDNIQVMGLDGNLKPILVGGGVRITTSDGSLLMSADLTDLVADYTAADPIFEGRLSNVQFTSLSADSSLLSEWSADVAAGKDFRFGFDPAILAASFGFATSASLSSFIAAATIPEPSTLGLLSLGLFASGWLRRRALLDI